MKKLIIALLAALSLTSASATEKNTVWLPFVGGTLDPTCRTLWKLYDTAYNAESEILPRQGAAGIAAMNDMFASKKDRKFMCTGSSMILINQLKFLDINSHATDVESIVHAVSFPIVWYVPNNQNATTIKELMSNFKSLNRSINVGVFIGQGNLTALHLSAKFNVPINLVEFKNGSQMYSPISDGTIDLAFDTGGALQVAEAKKFKVFGYVSISKIEKLSAYQNLIDEDQSLRAFESWFGISVDKAEMSREEIDTMAARLQTLIRSQEFKQLSITNINVPTGIVGNELQQIINKQRQLYKTLWK